MLAAWIFWSRNEKTRPQQPLPLVNTDLAGLPSGEDVMFGSVTIVVLQLAGKRILIDPVFSDYAAPFIINKAFLVITRGTRSGCRRSIC